MTWPSFTIGDKVLIYGHITRKYLTESLSSYRLTVLSYGDLLIQQFPNFYESPRQCLSRLLETAIMEKHSLIIFENFNEFLDEPGLWFYLKDFWFKRLEENATIIACVPDDDSSKVNLIKDHFLTILKVSELTKSHFNVTLIDMMTAEKESKVLNMEVNEVIEKMIKEGRTCAQLTNSNALLKGPELKSEGVNGGLNIDNVHGIDKEIKTALLDGATFVQGSEGPRGILLYGPPGTGKTRLVLALSRSLSQSTRFISVASSDLLRAEIGVSEEKLKEVFNLARSSQPAVIFFDEIDAIFPENPPLHLLSLQHQLIAELDSMERDQIISGDHCKVFLIAATNYLEKVSKRILGIERFHLKFEVKIPNDEQRWEIIVNELTNENLDEGFLKKLHKFTRGKTPAEITKIIQDAYKNLWSRVEKSADQKSFLKECDFSINSS